MSEEFVVKRKLPHHKYLYMREATPEEIPKYKPRKGYEIKRGFWRLGLYVEKGTSCVKCGVVCDRLILGNPNGSKDRHFDWYNKELTRMLTAGHIIPRCAGGLKDYSNLRPLCHVCNKHEGSSFDHIFAEPELFEAHCKGKQVKRKSGNKFQDGNEFAIIDRIFFSDKHKELYFGFVGGFTYPTDKVSFKIKPSTK